MPKQIIAFERPWAWTQQAWKVFRSRSAGGGSKLHVPLLDIKPEGELEREIKDIVEELSVMIHTDRTQRDVFKQLVNHVEHILDPSGVHIEKHHQDRKVGRSARHTAASRISTFRADSQVNTPTATAADRPYFNLLPDAGRATSPPLLPFSATIQRDGQAIPVSNEKTYDGFKINGQDMLIRIDGRIGQLEELARNAETTAASVSHFELPRGITLTCKTRSRTCSSSNNSKPASSRHGRPSSKAT